ncbi:MAG: lipocalin family protein [Ginsengibacter sp.]
MKNLTRKTKAILNLFFIVGILLLGSCKTDTKNKTSNGSGTEIQNSIGEKEFLIGSWKDNSEAALNFTLFKDGSARSDNMKTLLYKNWKVKGNQITFTIESVGNRTSSIDTVTYTIEKLTKTDLVLKNGTYLSEYTKQ